MKRIDHSLVDVDAYHALIRYGAHIEGYTDRTTLCRVEANDGFTAVVLLTNARGERRVKHGKKISSDDLLCLWRGVPSAVMLRKAKKVIADHIERWSTMPDHVVKSKSARNTHLRNCLKNAGIYGFRR
jgi:hypothetical protein